MIKHEKNYINNILHIEKIKKKCSACGNIKNISEFYKSKRSKDGHYPSCKECKKIISDTWKINNVEQSRKTSCLIAKRQKQKKPYIFVWRNILRSYLLRFNKIKKDTTENILGYSPLDLKNHLETYFNDNINWLNCGKNGWEIDHIIPINNFKSDTPPNIVNSLENLQILSYSENRSKGDKILLNIEKDRELYIKYKPFLKNEIIIKYDLILETEK